MNYRPTLLKVFLALLPALRNAIGGVKPWHGVCRELLSALDRLVLPSTYLDVMLFYAAERMLLIMSSLSPWTLRSSSSPSQVSFFLLILAKCASGGEGKEKEREETLEKPWFQLYYFLQPLAARAEKAEAAVWPDLDVFWCLM